MKSRKAGTRDQAVSHPSDSEAALWIALKRKGSLDAREKLFSFHLAFARQIATQHFLDRERGDIELPDLCQLACAGLLEAIDGFDPSIGPPFRAYARRRIAGSVLDGLAKTSEVREQISFRNRVRRERLRSLSVVNAEDLPTTQAMQALIDLAVGLALGFMLDGTTLYVADGEPDGRASAYDSLVWKETVRRVTREIANLPERDQSIFKYHYVNGLDFAQVGGLLGVSKGRVSQLHRAAIALLRKRLRHGGGDFKLER